MNAVITSDKRLRSAIFPDCFDLFACQFGEIYILSTLQTFGVKPTTISISGWLSVAPLSHHVGVVVGISSEP